MNYFDTLREAMRLLSADPRTLFIGQGVRWDNNAQFRTFQDADGTPIVPLDRRIELPVIEDFQAGFCLGLALQGYLPVCVYPRMDFMILACNQIVNHIDKLPYTSFSGRVIIRVGVGAKYPLDSGRQHTQDYSAAFRLMLRTMEVIELNSRFDILPAYRHALESERSVICVERQDLFNL